MQLPKDPVGLFESATWVFTNSDQSAATPPVPYFDLTTVTAVDLIVRDHETGDEKIIAGLQVLDQYMIEGGSEIQVRYIPIAGDLPDVGTYVGRVRMDNPDGTSESEPFMINVVPRDVA